MHLLVVLAFVGPPEPSRPPAAGPQTVRADAKVTAVRLRVAGTDVEPLRDALALRLPGVPLIIHEREPLDVNPSQSMVFVDLRPAVDRKQTFSLTVVVTDGRAYDRAIDTAGAESADDVRRLLATNVANLVAGIEAGTVVADRQNVSIPPVPAAGPCPACPPLAPRKCPPTPVGTPAPTPPSLLELGFDLAGAAVLGLGQPKAADRYAGAGAGAGVRLRHRNGATVHVDVRVLGRGSHYGRSIIRTRVGVGAGYVWRRNALELETTIAFVVEQWSLRGGNGKDTLTTPTAQRNEPGPLLGTVVRVAPGFRVWPSADLALRVGPRLEAGVGTSIGDGGRVAEVVVNDNGRLAPIGRVGGVELSLGAEVVLWFAVGNRRRGRRAYCERRATPPSGRRAVHNPARTSDTGH